MNRMWGRLSSLPVHRTFQSGGPKTGDSKVARTRRLESLRYEPVAVKRPKACEETKEGRAFSFRPAFRSHPN